MTQDRLETTLTADEGRVQDAVRRLPPVTANYGARARLRREFSTGRFSPPRPSPVLPPPVWVLALRRSPIPVALAAVLTFALLNRGPNWEFVSPTPAGTIEIEGTTVPLAEIDRVADRLKRGGAFTLAEGSELLLRQSDQLLVQATGGTAMTLPSPSGRWWKKTFHGRVDRGEARILTGEGFPGHRLLLDMPGGTAEVTGTLLSVATDGTLACVCVVEGVAWVGRTPESMEAIPAGMRKVMFTDTRPQVVLPIEPAHAAGLIQFRDSTSH